MSAALDPDENQARQLVGLPTETAAQVMQEAHDLTGGKPTASVALPDRPVLSAEGERLIAIKQPAPRWRPAPPPPAPRIGRPTVAGRLVVDLTDRPDVIEVAKRIGALTFAPDGAEVEIRLPRWWSRWPAGSLSLALSSWRDFPSVRIIVVGWTTQQVRDTCHELRAAIAEFTE